MTKFLKNLAQTPDRWTLIRDQIRMNETNGCPEAEVAFRLTGRHFNNSDWDEAAAAIHQPYKEARAVVLAADNRPGHIPELRALLLAATVNRPARPIPAPDPMDLALAELAAEGIPAEPAGKELAAV